MDPSVLASKGIRPSSSTPGYIDGYGLRIGRRATLIPHATERAYGVLMVLSAEEVTALYSEQSVADYARESVSVTLSDGRIETVACYILPENKLEGTNPGYAASLLTLADQLGLPRPYLEHIRNYVA